MVWTITFLVKSFSHFAITVSIRDPGKGGSGPIAEVPALVKMGCVGVDDKVIARIVVAKVNAVCIQNTFVLASNCNRMDSQLPSSGRSSTTKASEPDPSGKSGKRLQL